MGHITSKNYYGLQKRLDDSSQGAPYSKDLFKILEIIFTEKEAELVSVLPLKMFTAAKAAKIWKKSEKETKKILNELADKAILMDLRKGKTQKYVLAPTMAGFFEFSLMRTDGKFNRKVLSELYYQYINKESKFIKQILGLRTSIARTLIHEDTIQPKDESIILDYERASKIIETADCITVGTCYCRHKMLHVGKACDNPQNVCLSFNNAAKSLSKHGIAKKISKKQAKTILDKCMKLGLVQIGDNIQSNVNWICNCCGCCCEALLAYKRLGYMKMNTNFAAKSDKKKCIGCNICIKKCPVNAIKKEKGKKVKVDSKRCIGCGVCARFCPTKSMIMHRRKQTKFVPKDTFERYVVSAIEEGKLQNFIFDNYTLWTNDIFRRLLKTILNLGPAKRALANQQLRSRFLNAVTRSSRYSHDEMKKD